MDNNSINETVFSVTFAEQDWAVASNAGGNTCQAISPVRMQCNDWPGVSIMAAMMMFEIWNCQSIKIALSSTYTYQQQISLQGPSSLRL